MHVTEIDALIYADAPDALMLMGKVIWAMPESKHSFSIDVFP